MRTHNFFTRIAAVVAIISLVGTISCSEEETTVSQETASVAEESVTDVYYEDADNLAMVAVASDSRTAGGRVSSEAHVSDDDRLLCAGVVINFILDVSSTEMHPVGDITIDFGTEGCTDPRGNTRTGKIFIHFDGRRFLPGSVLTITFENYTINGIKLNGVRTLTNISDSTEDTPKFQVELDGSVEWPDGTNATRIHCYVRQWNRGSLDDLSDDQLVITQCAGQAYAAQGVNRRGVDYKMIIVSPLVYKRGCPIAVSGVKTFINVTTGKEMTIDYGDETCDRKVIVTVNGSAHTHTVED